MKKLTTTLALLAYSVVILVIISVSCEKTDSVNACYDSKLYELHKNDLCPTECDSIKGCDGVIYCNECEANKRGMKIK